MLVLNFGRKWGMRLHSASIPIGPVSCLGLVMARTPKLDEIGGTIEALVQVVTRVVTRRFAVI
jgi:hypothetical protein